MTSFFLFIGESICSKVIKENGKLVSHLLIDEPKKDINDYALLTKEEFDLKWGQWLKRV